MILVELPTLSPSESAAQSTPERLQFALQSFGVQGLLVLESGGLPLLVRDYYKNGIFRLDNANLLTGFISAINAYAESIHGLLTDIGLGGTRLVIKRSKGDLFVLFLEETINRRYSGEELTMFVEVTLYNLIKAFNTFFELASDDRGGYDKRTIDLFQHQADLLLYESVVGARKMVLSMGKVTT